MRRRYVYRPKHPKASRNGFVDAEILGLEDGPLAINAPVLVDRFYENTQATDGTDIGSRKKHREYMKAKGLAPASDFSDSWYAQQRASTANEAKKERREAIGRAVYEVLDKRR